MDPILGGALIGFGTSVASNIFSAKQAKKNRQFQERMSSTAHQREVADLRRAGINPALRAMGGASTPQGDRAEIADPAEGAARGVSTALAVKMQKAQIGLVEAQTQREKDSAWLLRTQVGSIQQEWEAGKWDLMKLDLRQRQEMLPLLLERAKAEIESMTNSARAARARAVLDEMAKERAGNIEEFERRIGEAGPAVRFFLEMLRSLR